MYVLYSICSVSLPMIVSDLVRLYTTDLYAPTRHIQKYAPDRSQKFHPLSYKYRGTTDRQKSDPQRSSGLLI